MDQRRQMTTRDLGKQVDRRRKGATAVVLAVTAPILLSFAALAVDMGYVHNARIDLQNAADSAALAGATALANINNLYVQGTSDEALADARLKAIDFAAFNKAANKSVYLDKNANNLADGDIVIGFLEHPELATGNLDLSNPRKFNAVQVRARRTNDSPSDQAGPISLFFARIMGFQTAQLTATATAILDSRFVTYKPPGDGVGALLPISVSQNAWNDYIVQKHGPDTYSFTDGVVQTAPDSVPELLMYPWPNNAPGNFGLLHVGNPNNFSGVGGTTRLVDQITNGVSQQDLIDFHGKPMIDVYDTNGIASSYNIDGDTGLRAALEDALLTRYGRVVGFFIHDRVDNVGTGAIYHIVRIQFARLVEIALKTGEKVVYVQPVPYTSDEIGTGGTGSSTDGMIGNLQLVR